MRHAKRVKKLGRTKSHRKAMLANMVASLLTYQVIKTTETKAKEVRKLAEKLISLAKRGDLHAHRQVYDVIKDRKLVKKLFDEIAPKFADREGGYTRVSKLGPRRGDGAPLSVVELLLERAAKEEKKGKKRKGEKKAKPAEAKEAEPKKERKKEKVKAKATEVEEKEESEDKTDESKEGRGAEPEEAGSEESK
ncbi:MAG: 50S ribosomal protein L17 [Candidatus Zixiibacteriota bacterium]|nr:MAG: 50S ribosomal protein L17 [candidate division Zixibacteria bacterium]